MAPGGATRPLNVLFAGRLAAASDQGGLPWIALQWTLGLRRLGHRVTLVEALEAGDVERESVGLAASAPARRLRRIARDFGLEGSTAVWLRDSTQSAGLSWNELRKRGRETDLVIDVAGALAGSELLEAAPVRLYLDLDPGFTQLWQEVVGIDMGLDGHTHFATVGLGFDDRAPSVPDCGRRWIPVAPPVLLDEWPFAGGIERDAWTTVANWRGYGSIEADGVFFGQKAHSLRKLIDLPERTGERFALALAIDPGEPRDLAALDEHGWELLDPRATTGTPSSYRRFVQGSRGELGVAKSGYVEGRCGWFSDRSVCYLASGRPVIAQDTGLASALPVGEGLFAFSSVDDAAAALDELRRDYPRQRRAARALAEEVFNSDVVLPRLLRRLELAS
jgi:hypothetical protein